VTLAIGCALFAGILAVSAAGPVLVDVHTAIIGAEPPGMAPSASHPLGTDTQGRDLLTVLLLATPQTLKIGLLAGAVGLGAGVLLGLLAGYFSGAVDAVIRTSADVFTTIPSIAILVLLATYIRVVSVELMALIVASLAWPYPTRAIRAQVLSLRERAYVQVAILNGVRGVELIVTEVLPNLLPYIAASFVAVVSNAMLATIGLEILGLGPQNTFTLGTTIYWAQFYGAILRGMWWWWGPPIAVIVLIFLSLLMASAGMDRIVNKRLSTRA